MSSGIGRGRVPAEMVNNRKSMKKIGETMRTFLEVDIGASLSDAAASLAAGFANEHRRLRAPEAIATDGARYLV